MAKKYDGLRRKVKEYKEKHGISYFDMSLDIGCSYTSLINFERGKELKPNIMAKIEFFFVKPITMFEQIKMMNLDEMTGFLLDFKKLTSNRMDFLDVKKKLLEKSKRRKYVRKS